MANEIPPKVFVSYAWTTPQHENWVLDLAANLRQYHGVDAILDKWDLNPGDDSIPFMERMANDDTIKKVIMICDKNYVEKANGRKGGVGIETQIISKKVYEKSNQSKFAAVIRENDEKGNAYVPTYFHSRMYFDFTDEALYSEKFKELVLWIYDKPIYEKPEIGHRPSFLEDKMINMGTNIKQKRVIDNITNGRNPAKGSIREYFDDYYEKLELFRVKNASTLKETDENILKNLEAFTPFRDEFLSVISCISRYEPGNNLKADIQKFFENSLSYLNRPDNTGAWDTYECEIFKFILYELFIYTIAILLKNEGFDILEYLLNTKYYIKRYNKLFGNDTLLSFCALRNRCVFVDGIDKYYNYFSHQAAFLDERNKSSNINFYYLMEADFICFIRAELINESWWPDTLIFLDTPHRPFELFAKAVSDEYFEIIKKIFDFKNVTDIAIVLNKLTDDRKRLPDWHGHGFNPITLMGFEQLALTRT